MIRRTAFAAGLALLLAAHPVEPQSKLDVRTWLESGPADKCVDVLFVGDGYIKKDLADNGKYWRDVQRYAKRLFEEPPFAWYRAKFNVRAAFLESKAQGCDLAPDQEKVDTVLQCHFDAPEGRLLVFKDHARLKQIVGQCGAVDIVFVMVNTQKYGGAGTTLFDVTVRGHPLPAPTFSAQDTTSFLIAVHELGHSFAWLADEYEDVTLQDKFKLPKDGKDVEAPNATLPAFFDASSFDKLKATVKWKHFLALPGAERAKWVHEGGYYRSHGVFRPWQRCLMLDLTSGQPFCPICAEEVAKSIVQACGDTWDDATYHKQHPMTLWK